MDYHPHSTESGPIHRYQVRVYYEDTDAGGVVYHANYLRFAERARTEALRSHGADHAGLREAHRVMFVVRRIDVEYLRAARLDDLLVVTTRPMALAGASMRLSQTIERSGERSGAPDILVRLDVRLACVDMDGGRAARIPAGYRARLAGLFGGDGESGVEVLSGSDG